MAIDMVINGELVNADVTNRPLGDVLEGSGFERSGSDFSGFVGYPVLDTETGVVAGQYPYGEGRRYGAVGDGVTNDRTAIFNANAESTFSRRLVPGTYLVNSDLTLSGVWSLENGAVIKPASGVTITISETTRIYAESEWRDESLGGTFSYSSGSYAELVFSDGAGSSPNQVRGFAGNNALSSGNTNVIAGGGTSGSPNEITGAGSYRAISGGYDNVISTTGVGADTIAGGAHHRIGGTVTHGTIGGGSLHTIAGAADYVTISGGTDSTVTGASQVTVAGGAHHRVESTGASTAIGGGTNHAVEGNTATISGGNAGVAIGNGSAISGGTANVNKGGTSAIGGGERNAVGPAGTRSFADAVTTASDNTVTSATGDFAAGDVGRTVYITGCVSPNNSVLKTTIASINSTTSIEVTVAPTVSRTAQVLTIIPTATAIAGGSIGGGLQNKVTADYGRVGGGRLNTVSGSQGVVGGGFTNTASGTQSTVGGGTLNDATATTATVGGGVNNDATNTAATVAGGELCVASGTRAAIGGGLSNAVSADYGNIPGGRENTVSQIYGHASGRGGVTRSYAEHCRGSGYFVAAGDSQARKVTGRIQTTNATTTTIPLDGSSALIGIAEGSAICFTGRVIALRTDAASEAAGWSVVGTVRRNTGGSATVIAFTATTTGADAAAATWALTTTSGTASWALRGTGEAAKTIRWTVDLDLVEVLIS